MPIDRAATLKNAEKLLRQGKLDQAIAEYVRVVEEQPRDWNTANVLGDLYIRARQVDKAVEQYIRIADHLSEEGFVQKAGAIYKKILKIKPDDEHALWQAAEIAGSQGLLVDARGYLKSLADLRRARNDARGVAQIAIRLGSLDAGDYDARRAAARARADINDTAGALRDYKEIAEELTEKGRPGEAVEALRQAALLEPDDADIRDRLLEVYLASGDYARARECATSVEQLKNIAAQLTEAGQPDEALLTLRDAAKLDPDNAGLKTHLAQTFVSRGDMSAAAEYLTVESAGGDPRLLLTVAEIRLRRGDLDEGIAIVKGLLERDPARRQDVAVLGWSVAEQLPELGHLLVQISADTSVAQQDWPSAAAALQEFVTRVPNHVPALMRLVEVCVDGRLEATMYSAQAHLADAYLTAGAAAEARFIAEDLVAREPWERANIERFRNALVLMGEPDPDGIIAERLSGESPFISTDLSLHSDELPPFVEPEDVAPVALPPAPQAESEAAAAIPAPSPEIAPGLGLDRAIATAAIDLKSLRGDLAHAASAARGKHESVEVDLSIVLDDIRALPANQAAAEPPPVPERVVPAGGDIDTVFARLREEASRRAGVDTAAQDFEHGVVFHKAGQLDEAVAALQRASRAARLRFPAASLVGRIYRDRGDVPKAIEWLERASQAPAPTPGDYHLLLYELADLLESNGEVARALAICMELKADAGEFRDVGVRVDRLAKVQTRG